MPLKVGEGLLRETFAILRHCGQGSRECVSYWSGSLDDPLVVDQVHHPCHTARAGWYEVDGAWLTKVWIELANEKRAIRVQIHTHGGSAFHSLTDDEFPIVATPGFLSLVVPRFAMGRVTLEDAHLSRLDSDGRWRHADISAALEVVQ